MIFWRRLLFVVGLESLAGPPDFAAWHHSLEGVFVTVAAAWLVAVLVIKD